MFYFCYNVYYISFIFIPHGLQFKLTYRIQNKVKYKIKCIYIRNANLNNILFKNTWINVSTNWTGQSGDKWEHY